jgi:cell migration-inducing and hyaluronan-binding protein
VRATVLTPAAPAKPITLSRNGKDFKVTANQSTVRSGTEIRVKTERPEVAIGLTEMAKDSWVVFELPGFANAASGKQQDSLDALRKANETSYFKGSDAVWVKLVIPTAPQGVGRDQFGPLDTQTSITVIR